MEQAKKWLQEFWPALAVLFIGALLWWLKGKTESLPTFIQPNNDTDALRYASDLAINYSQSLVSLATIGIGGNGVLILNHNYRKSRIFVILVAASFFALLLSLFASTVLYDLAFRMARVHSLPAQAANFLAALQWQYRLLFFGIICLIMNLLTIVARK